MAAVLQMGVPIRIQQAFHFVRGVVARATRVQKTVQSRTVFVQGAPRRETFMARGTANGGAALGRRGPRGANEGSGRVRHSKPLCRIRTSEALPGPPEGTKALDGGGDRGVNSSAVDERRRKARKS